MAGRTFHLQLMTRGVYMFSILTLTRTNPSVSRDDLSSAVGQNLNFGGETWHLDISPFSFPRGHFPVQ